MLLTEPRSVVSVCVCFSPMFSSSVCCCNPVWVCACASVVSWFFSVLWFFRATGIGLYRPASCMHPCILTCMHALNYELLVEISLDQLDLRGLQVHHLTLLHLYILTCMQWIASSHPRYICILTAALPSYSLITNIS